MMKKGDLVKGAPIHTSHQWAYGLVIEVKNPESSSERARSWGDRVRVYWMDTEQVTEEQERRLIKVSR